MNYVPVELHRRFPGLRQDPQIQFKFDKDLISGISIPTPNERIFHAIVHSLVHDMHSYLWTIDLRTLYDVYRIAVTHASRVDWIEIRRRMKVEGLETRLMEFVCLSNILFRIDYPVDRKVNGLTRLKCQLMALRDDFQWVHRLTFFLPVLFPRDVSGILRIKLVRFIGY